MRYHDPQLLDALAAEYVLGTLHGRARQRFQRLLAERSEVRRHVAGWEAKLNRLAALSQPVAPPAATWRTLKRRLFTPPRAPRWYQRLSLWRSLALGSGLVAAVLAGLLVWLPPRTPMPGYVTVITDPAQHPMWAVATSAAMDTLTVRSTQPMKVAPGMACILWLQVKGSGHAYMIGKLPDHGNAMHLRVAARLRHMLLHGELLVTIENVRHGMPAAPNGPALYSGRLAPLAQS